MENLIAKLLTDFEQGKMNRRQLIQSLAMASAAASAASAATSGSLGLKAVAVNHISYAVPDYKKTRDWYADVLGMGISHDDGNQCYMTFGNGSWLLPRNNRRPEGQGRAGGQARTPEQQAAFAATQANRKPVTGLVNHIAYTIDNWDADRVKSKLESYGLTPRVDTENSFHVTDPDGYDVQISGEKMKP
jgi:catechol 2,3-dioxygenase-like lactoylglutathione lyase family enzyme